MELTIIANPSRGFTTIHLSSFVRSSHIRRKALRTCKVRLFICNRAQHKQMTAALLMRISITASDIFLRKEQILCIHICPYGNVQRDQSSVFGCRFITENYCNRKHGQKAKLCTFMVHKKKNQPKPGEHETRYILYAAAH